MTYFDPNDDRRELRKQFLMYCNKLHPDKGGNPDEFKTMHAEYVRAVHDLTKPKKPKIKFTKVNAGTIAKKVIKKKAREFIKKNKIKTKQKFKDGDTIYIVDLNKMMSAFIVRFF